MERFKNDVLDAETPPEQADVLLSTVHTAKGMEWDTVQPGFLLLWCTTLWILQLYLGRRDAETPQLAAHIENTSRLRWLALAAANP